MIVAHVDHGKSTIIDCLSSKNNIYFEKRYPTYADYAWVSTRSPSIPLYFEHHDKDTSHKSPYLINLFHSTNNTDLAFEVNSTFKISDGVLVVYDYEEGVCMQTEAFLRCSLAQKVRPALMINKVDRAILQLQHDGESMYQSFTAQIDTLNTIIGNYEHPDMDDLKLCPVKGNVVFGSGRQGWGFTLLKFAQVYSSKFNVPKEKLVSKFWGDNYFNSDTKLWTSECETEDGKTLKRGFVLFVMDPIIKLYRCIMEGDRQQINKLLEKLQIKLTEEEEELEGVQLARRVLSKWIDLTDSLFEMFVVHLPSPKAAQKYRVSYLYEGPQDDVCAQAIRDCDTKGPLMIYICKTITSSDLKNTYVFGRVFSGTVSSGQKVRIMGSDYELNKRKNSIKKEIEEVVFMQGTTVKPLEVVPCGGMVGLTGFESYFSKGGTISDYEEAHGIRSAKHSSAMIFRITIEPKNAVHLPWLAKIMGDFAKSEPCLTVINEETGQYIIAGSSMQELKMGLSNLEGNYIQFPITRSEPFICYQETVSSASQVCSVKSPNKHNTFSLTAQPLDTTLTEFIEAEELTLKDDPELLTKRLIDDFSWEQEQAKHIWAFGPANKGSNVLVDLTKGGNNIDKIKEACQNGFYWATREGVLCGEQVRQVKFDIQGVALHSNVDHRNSQEVTSAFRKACLASMLASRPRLLEPIYSVEVTASEDLLANVYELIKITGGAFIAEEEVSGSCVRQVLFHLRASEILGNFIYL